MGVDQSQQIVLTLDHPDDLFHTPDFDPFSGKTQTETGIDQLIDELQLRRSPPDRVVIRFPAACLSPDLEARCRAAVMTYCLNRILQIDREKTRMKRREYRSLRYGGAFLAICLGLSGVLGNWSVIPGALQQFFGEGFVIVGWVALWHPAEMLLFDRWPLTNERRMLKQVKTLKIDVRPVPD